MKSLLKSFTSLHREESGQGLVEYVLLIALVAFAATAGMTKLASSINSAFSQVGTILGTYIT
ncbi:MAG TPA: Flp family type IVb pilin [Terriglobia bacterium]|nr:Flp family type IVb pilin [Terriglobia bacterium]